MLFQLVEEYNYYPYGLVFDATQASPTIKKLIIFTTVKNYSTMNLEQGMDWN
jgi:hypothetical protein